MKDTTREILKGMKTSCCACLTLLLGYYMFLPTTNQVISVLLLLPTLFCVLEIWEDGIEHGKRYTLIAIRGDLEKQGFVRLRLETKE